METPQPPNRRDDILAAALTCFLGRGYAATSIADIRKASGASTGSIYHFFANKAALALALLEQAVGGWSTASASALDPDAPAEAAIKASVRGFVDWGEVHPELLRFMDEIRTLAAGDPDFVAVRRALVEGQELGEARYLGYLAKGEVRPLPWLVARALMLGPAYDYLRLSAPPAARVAGAAELFAAAAWEAVRAP